MQARAEEAEAEAGAAKADRRNVSLARPSLKDVEEAAEAMESARLAADESERRLAQQGEAFKASQNDLKDRLSEKEAQIQQAVESLEADRTAHAEALSKVQESLAEKEALLATSAEALQEQEVRFDELNEKFSETREWAVEAEQRIAETEQELRQRDSVIESQKKEAAEEAARRERLVAEASEAQIERMRLEEPAEAEKVALNAQAAGRNKTVCQGGTVCCSRG